MASERSGVRVPLSPPPPLKSKHRGHRAPQRSRLEALSRLSHLRYNPLGRDDHEHGVPTRDPRPARHAAELQELAHRGAPAHADEQPRPRGGGRPPALDRLRRHGAGRPQLGGLRQDRRDAPAPGNERDAPGPVRQARGRVRNPRGRAARVDRQRAARARLGHLGQVPRARAAGADHVRPDDRRLLDLHRHAGHPAGHV